jgi:uncharacterized protein (DUF1697 family)
MSTRYVALLRGINVGGKNLIKMAALKRCFEEHGFAGVSTFIQSGNVLFESAEADRARLAAGIERMLTAVFGYPASVVLRSRRDLQQIVDRAPAGFGARPALYRYDVLFLKEPLQARAALAQVPVREGVDQAHAGRGVLYFSRLIRKASQSQLGRISLLPLYKQLTIRNWNTTTRLLRLM